MTHEDGKRAVKKIMASSIAKAAIMKGVPPDDILSMSFAKTLIENTQKAFDDGGIVAVLAMTKRVSKIIAQAIKDQNIG